MGSTRSEALVSGQSLLPLHRLSTLAWRRIACGFSLGVLIWLAALQQGATLFPMLRWIDVSPWGPLAWGALGAAAAGSRARQALWIVAAALSGSLLVITCTPFVARGVQGLVRRDALRPAEAMVVLTGGIRNDGHPGSDTNERLVYAYELLGRHYARRLVVTRGMPPTPSHRAVVERQIRLFGLRCPVDEAPGPTRDTHDEAVTVARMARQRRWTRVILITQPTHSRRAAAVFEHAGLDVISAPCPEGRYDMDDLVTPTARITAFGDWLREVVGYEFYRLRGWI